MPDATNRDRVGFVGTGVMGTAMAVRALGAGYHTTVFDVDPERLAGLVDRNAHAVGSLQELSRVSGVIVLSLPGPTTVSSVVADPDGIGDHASEGTVVIDTSTVDPFTSRKLAEAAASRAIDYLAAPVIGGEPAARTGTLTMVVGGAKAAFRRTEPLLQHFASDITHVEDPGAATALKLVNNLMSLSNTVTLMEALALGARVGVPPSLIYETLRTGSGFSAAFERRWTKHVATGDYRAGFSVDLALKDLGLVQVVAEGLSVPTFMCAAAIQMFRLLQLSGMGRDDVASLARWWEENADVRFGPA